MRINFLKMILTFSFMFISVLMYSQVTRSGISGTVENEAGVEVTATHEPTGTVYKTTTDKNGYFQFNNVRVGGPYTITAGNKTETDVMLNLGETYNVVFQTQEEVGEEQLTDVVVVGNKLGVFGKDRTGAETNISREQIQTLPSVSGSIADYVRLSPQVKVSEGSDGYSISIAGQNNRLNALYVDGGVNNDMFGLSGSGTDGGQTGGNPFALDELDQITVSPAPYDVKQSGFAGGAINAVTKSGTNSLSGSAYYFLRNERFAGKTAEYNEDNRVHLGDFTAKRYGASLGGAIIKNKLFLFATYEREDIDTPQPFDFSTDYRGASNRTTIDQIINRVKTVYGYDPGAYEGNSQTLKGDKFVARLDWNINENNSITAKYKYTKFDNVEPYTSGTDLRFLNGTEQFLSKINYATLEWNSKFGSKFSNQAILSYKKVNDDRDPLGGQAFPTIQIYDGTGSSGIQGNGIYIGPERFSTANLLTQEIITFQDNFDISLTNHTVSLGLNYEYSNIVNLFLGSNYGIYYWSTPTAFLNGAVPNTFATSYSYDGKTGDDAIGAAANFDMRQYGFYAQDKWNVNKNFTLIYGFRLDLPVITEGQYNNAFNTTAIPLFEKAGYDLQGAQVGGKVIKDHLYFSPRLGFNWKINGEYKTQVRGGTGIFTSRIPLVWPGGAYNNNGLLSGFYQANNRPFTTDVNNLPIVSSTQTPSIDIFAKDMKAPQVWKTSLGFDQDLPYGLILTSDFMYTDVINGIKYQNVNIAQPTTFTSDGLGNRPRWSTAAVSSSYGRVILGSNTSEGYSWSWSTSITKRNWHGLTGSIGYTIGNSKDVFPATSSQNSSQWRGLPTVYGKNYAESETSDFAQGQRLNGYLSYKINWLKDKLTTTISFVYTGQSGTKFSYIYGTPGGRILNDDSSDNALIYIPKDLSEINLVAATGYPSVEQQWAMLDSYIKNDSYLNSHRGEYAERNGATSPWYHVIDARLVQDFNMKFGGKKHKISISLDIFNFTNLLNKEWGQIIRPSTNTVPLINVVGYNNTTRKPSYAVNSNLTDYQKILTYDNTGTQSSVWQMQLGIKYSF